MLKHFQVTNYKCFEKLDFDLSSSDYSFNPLLIKDGIANKVMIYGKNGSGKSSLGFALFDIVHHLTDCQALPQQNFEYYANLNFPLSVISFVYTFSFDYKELLYSYEKNSSGALLHEKLIYENKVLLDYSYESPNCRFIAPSLKKELNVDLKDNRLSVLKYIHRNSPTSSSEILDKLMNFCENMLWFRSLSDGNSYCGFTTGSANLEQLLFEQGRLSQFSEFLASCGLNYHLAFEDDGGQPRLYAYFGQELQKKARFINIASAGTKALMLLFIWLTKGENKFSLLFIDEFDAFYHYEAAADILALLNSKRRFQTIVTTHNTYLMQNKFTRPDCCFLLSNYSLKNLKNSTERELREAHNLEKLYINGAFIE